MKPKRISVRFNLDNEADKQAWEYLQRMDGSKNKAIITAINSFYEAGSSTIADVIRHTIKDCFCSISIVQAKEEPIQALSEDETALLDTLDDFIGS